MDNLIQLGELVLSPVGGGKVWLVIEYRGNHTCQIFMMYHFRKRKEDRARKQSPLP